MKPPRISAAELSLSLYRVNVASIVDKYVGETEKNLRRIFDAADASDCVLLFDEADAIFTTRIRVQTSTDRYSNTNVNFLLQKLDIEAEGLQLLELRSRKTDSQFERILLGLNENRLKVMIMEDAFGLRTELRFRGIERNLPLDDSLFTFVPPPGVDLIGDVPDDERGL